MLKKCIFILVLLFSQICFASEPVELPAGWRMPSEQELSQDWRVDNKTRYAYVNGDFDGDSKIDLARGLVSIGSNKFALIVSMQQAEGKYIHIVLDNDDTSWFGVMGIDLVTPGKYRTACGKGYWECKDGEPEEIIIEYDAINYFREESANSFYYWDKTSSSFKRIWISD